MLPSNYLYCMKLGANDLKMMITECVQRILEYHGAIDDSFEKLAEIEGIDIEPLSDVVQADIFCIILLDIGLRFTDQIPFSARVILL